MSSQLAAKMDDENSEDEEQDKKAVSIKKKEPSKSKEKTHARSNKKEAMGKKTPRKVHEASEEGEVSSEDKEFDDGLDDDLMGNEEDRDYLEGLTEKEREEVSINFKDGQPFPRI